MPIPKTIRVGAADYDIVVEKIHEIVGLAFRDKGVIQLSPDQSRDAMFNTAWHESLHMAFRAASISLSERNEEKIINSITEYICQILRDNESMRNAERWT